MKTRTDYTVDEAAEILGVSRPTLRKYMRAGLLDGLTVPGQGTGVRFPADADFPEACRRLAPAMHEARKRTGTTFTRNR